jgi:hypothetical protein
MKRFVTRHAMRWEYLELMLLVMMIIARAGMAHHAFQGREDGKGSLGDCFDAYSIVDYIRMTREETGRIGEWFWVFTSSTAMLVIVVIAVLTGETGAAGPNVRLDQDFLWPVL